MPNLDDDLDWLYRRGRYAAGHGPVPGAAPAPGAAPEPPARPSPAPPAPSPAWRPAPPTPAPAAAPPPARPLAGRPPTPVGRPAAEPLPRRRRRRHPIRWLVVGLLLVAAYLVGVPLAAWSGLAHVDYAPAGQRPPEQPGTLLLLAGSDSRDGLSLKQTQELGTGTEGGNVADTIMLLYLPPSGKPALISLPRDSYVTIPGKGKNKINASFAAGGPKLLTATVEQNTGLRVDGYLAIGFGGFVSIIDALGGIEQCPTYDIKDENSHLDLKKGCQQMDGITALKYVRMRYADPQGDLGRVQRQRGMVAAVAKKAMSPLVIANPVMYYSLNKAGAAALKAGNGTGLTEIAPAALAFQSISKGDGYQLTVPIAEMNADTSAGSAVLWDKAKSTELFGMIARGDTSGLDKFKK